MPQNDCFNQIEDLPSKVSHSAQHNRMVDKYHFQLSSAFYNLYWRPYRLADQYVVLTDPTTQFDYLTYCSKSYNFIPHKCRISTSASRSQVGQVISARSKGRGSNLQRSFSAFLENSVYLKEFYSLCINKDGWEAIKGKRRSWFDSHASSQLVFYKVQNWSNNQNGSSVSHQFGQVLTSFGH